MRYTARDILFIMIAAGAAIFALLATLGVVNVNV